MWAAAIGFHEPNKWLASGGWGRYYGLPAAIGAQILARWSSTRWQRALIEAVHEKCSTQRHRQLSVTVGVCIP
jgi:hypothetical protein